MQQIKIPAQDVPTMEKLARDIRKLKDNPIKFRNELYHAMIYMYNLGLAAGINGEVVESGRCIPVDKNEQWQITCPYCGETYDINLEAMLPKENNELGVMV